MIKCIFYVLALSSLLLFSCQQQIDIASEKEAIKAVNQKQVDAMGALDYNGEFSVWLHEPYILHATADGGKGKVGWDSLSAYYKEIFEKYKKNPENRIEFICENFDIHIDGNIAFVIYDQTINGTLSGEEIHGESQVHKYFVKKDGEWKILAVF